MAAKSGGDIYRKRHADLTPFEQELKSVSARGQQLRHQRRRQGAAFKQQDELLFIELRFSQMQQHAKELGYVTCKPTRLEERLARQKAEQEKLNAPVPEPSGWEAWSADDDVA